jgi:putative hemolysin
MKRNAKQIVFIGAGLLLMFFLILSTSQTFAMLNPAAAYCSALGYEYFTGLTKKGERTLCKLPNNEIVDAYDFLRGKVALTWSYCAKMGYEVKRVESSDICKDCTVCILRDGTEVEGTKLMKLNVMESLCGDGTCGTSENFSNCPQDCPSGGMDNFCDGIQDQRCDSDCVERGENDADCPLIFVDIKPGSCPNPLELSHKSEQNKGVLPVAILGTVAFDVKGINPNTIRMKRPECMECSSISPVRWSYEDVATPYAGGQQCGCNKRRPDGYLDLTLKFDLATVAEKLKLYDVYGQTISVTIKADPYDDQGAPIRAHDCIVIHKEKTKDKKKKKAK